MKESQLIKVLQHYLYNQHMLLRNSGCVNNLLKNRETWFRPMIHEYEALVTQI